MKIDRKSHDRLRKIENLHSPNTKDVVYVFIHIGFFLFLTIFQEWINDGCCIVCCRNETAFYSSESLCWTRLLIYNNNNNKNIVHCMLLSYVCMCEFNLFHFYFQLLFTFYWEYAVCFLILLDTKKKIHSNVILRNHSTIHKLTRFDDFTPMYLFNERNSFNIYAV